MNKTSPAPQPLPTAAPPVSETPLSPVRRIASSSLFQGAQTEVQIEHQQQVYRLRVTALGKLILTK